MALPREIVLALLLTAVVAFGSHWLFAAPDRHADFAGLGQFDGIVASGPDDVVVSQGNGFSVRVDGPRSAIKRMDVEVVQGRLRISRRQRRFLGFDWGWWNGGNRDATIRVTMPSIHAVTLSGSGDVRLNGVTGDRLDLALNGSGDVDAGSIRVATLSAQLVGSGDLSMSGTADHALLSVRGSGDIGARSLKAGNVDINLSGSGDIAVASDGKAAVTMHGSGDVEVAGRAQCTLSKSGSGDLACG